MITDLAVLMEFYRKEINMEALWDDLEEIHLEKFAMNLYTICRTWFGLETGKMNYTSNNMETVENYIISGGVFGHDAVIRDSVQISKQKGIGLIKIFRWAFPSYSHMREYSLWFKEKPAILLPAAYLERFIRNTRERGGILKWQRKLVQGKRANKIQKNIVEMMGLENER